MRIARKLALLLTMAIAAMALAATTASADEAITVANEPGSACDPTCTIHVAGESSLAAFHVITVSACTDEFTGTIDANGNGEVDTWDGVFDVDPGCTREQCRVQPGNTVREHWPFTSEEIADQTVELNVEFCLSLTTDMSDAAKTRCDVPAIVTESSNHDYEIGLSHECLVGPPGSQIPVEVHGDWHVEGGDFEFVHAS